MVAIIQFEMFDDEDIAQVYVGGKWRKVPLWMWCELEGDGIKGIIQTWQGGILMKYYPPPVIRMIEMGVASPDVEDDVLRNIHRHAKAMQRFMRGNYRETLSPLELKALDLEVECMEDTKLTGWARYEWIATHLSNKREKYTPRMAQSILDNASMIVMASYETDVAEKLVKSVRALRELWLEVSNSGVLAA